MERSREQLLLVKECHPLYLATEVRIYLGCADFAWIARPVYCSSLLSPPSALERFSFFLLCLKITPLAPGKVSQVTSCSNHLDFSSAEGTFAATLLPPPLGELPPTSRKQRELLCCIVKWILRQWSMTEQSLVWMPLSSLSKKRIPWQSHQRNTLVCFSKALTWNRLYGRQI